MINHFDEFSDKGRCAVAEVAIVYHKHVVLQRYLDLVSCGPYFCYHKQCLYKLSSAMHRTRCIEVFKPVGPFDDVTTSDSDFIEYLTEISLDHYETLEVDIMPILKTNLNLLLGLGKGPT